MDRIGTLTTMCIWILGVMGKNYIKKHSSMEAVSVSWCIEIPSDLISAMVSIANQSRFGPDECLDTSGD